MAVLLEEAVERLRKRIEGGATRLAIQAPPGFGKTTVLDGLAAALEGKRHVVRVAFPEGDDAALAALVEAATQLGFIKELMPQHEPARLTWAARLGLVRKALAGVGAQLVLLIDEPCFGDTKGPLGELFARRATELTDTLLGVRGAAVVLAGTSIPHGVAENADLDLPIFDDPWAESTYRLGGHRPPSPGVQQVLRALDAAGIDLKRIPRGDLRLDRIVAHDLGPIFLQSPELRMVIARLSAIRVPFSNALLERAGYPALSRREQRIIDPLLSGVSEGMVVLPAALAHVIRARIAKGDPAWAPDEPAGDAHLFAAQHHRSCYEAAHAGGDVGAAVRAELEEIHHLTEAGDATALLARSLQFVEQYDALGKSLSQRALRTPREVEEKLRREAVRAYERALEHDARDAYAHHYIAYNLDILAIERERVEREYVIAKDLDRLHPWYHSRHVCFLITTGWIDEARAAWERALVDLEESEERPLAAAGYRELHAEVANHLLSRAHLGFAREVLQEVPDERRGEPWWRALDQLCTCLEEDRDERLVFPPTLPLARRWEGPHLATNVGELPEVKRWRPGRVLGRDDEVILLYTAERAPDDAGKLTTMSLEASRTEEEWSVPQRMLAAGTFVELLEYDDGSREMKTWDPSSSSFAAIPNLPGIFPRPDRYIRRAFTDAR